GGGTIGFHELLNEAWHNAFYRTSVTVTLTGLDTTPGTTGAQLLTIALAVGGVAIFGYLVAQAIEAVTREVMGEARKEKHRRRMIDKLDNHYIICGYGRVGRRSAEEFEASGTPYVVLDNGKDAIEVAKRRGILYLEGSGSDDDSLQA